MKQELIKLREIMKQNNIDLYIAKDADDHISEYNDPYFSVMRFLSGFTGGDGTLVVTDDQAALWTDGRYFIQAESELSGSGIELMKEGEPDCVPMEQWIFDQTGMYGTIGFDGRCISYRQANELILKLKDKKISVKADRDLTKEIWITDRPVKNAKSTMILSIKYAGKTVTEKISEVIKEMNRNGAKAHVISAMDEIAWLLNMRGNDVPFCPVFDAFLFIGDKKVKLYISEDHLDQETKTYIEQNGIQIDFDTERIYEDVKLMKEDSILLDGDSTSYRMVKSVQDITSVIFATDPAAKMKCLKNSTEAENLKQAQKKDSVAVTKFMFWFKKSLKDHKEITELSAAKKLHEFRKEQIGFLGDSFPTISAWGPNAAMCHYVTDPSCDVKVEDHGLYLVDSGGHYLEGTTDITRTWSCGAVTEEEKKAYTLTAIANLRLASQVFPEGVSSMTLDLSAREVFWKHGMDYNHGTGHGVGYLLYVHEGPTAMRYRPTGRVKDNILCEGVYISDEPGYYAEGKFGVRLENMEIVKHTFTNEYHKFLCFDTLTLVPFDRSCIEPKLMSEEDKMLYNSYHKTVYNIISPFLSNDENIWLKEQCKPIE